MLTRRSAGAGTECEDAVFPHRVMSGGRTCLQLYKTTGNSNLVLRRFYSASFVSGQLVLGQAGRCGGSFAFLLSVAWLSPGGGKETSVHPGQGTDGSRK